MGDILTFTGVAPDLDIDTPGVFVAANNLIPVDGGWRPAPDWQHSISNSEQGSADITRVSLSLSVTGDAGRSYGGRDIPRCVRPILAASISVTSGYTIFPQIPALGPWYFAYTAYDLFPSGGARLYRKQADTNALSDLSPGGTAISLGGELNPQFTMCQYGNKIFASNIGCGTILEIDYVTPGSAFASISGAPAATFLVPAGPPNGKSVIALSYKDGASISTVDGYYISALNNPNGANAWVPSIATQCVKGQLFSPPGRITAGIAYGNDVVVFKNRAIYLGRYTGAGPFFWNWQLISDEVGVRMMNNNNVCIGDGKLWFVADNGLHVFNGQQIEYVNLPFQQTLQEFINNQMGSDLYPRQSDVEGTIASDNQSTLLPVVALRYSPGIKQLWVIRGYDPSSRYRQNGWQHRYRDAFVIHLPTMRVGYVTWPYLDDAKAPICFVDNYLDAFTTISITDEKALLNARAVDITKFRPNSYCSWVIGDEDVAMAFTRVTPNWHYKHTFSASEVQLLWAAGSYHAYRESDFSLTATISLDPTTYRFDKIMAAQKHLFKLVLDKNPTHSSGTPAADGNHIQFSTVQMVRKRPAGSRG